MLQFFRTVIHSKAGAIVAIVFLALIALAFGLADVTGSKFGGVAGGDRVAMVGKERIDTATLSQAASSALERVKQRDPTMSMKGFIASGGLEEVLDNLIDRIAIAGFGKQHGIVASDRLIDSEITQVPAFKGADGAFSQDLFRRMLRQQGISEAMLRDDLAQGLIARQVMIPAAMGAQVPHDMAERYAALLTETRKGEIAVLPSALFAAKAPPSDAQVAEFYKRNKARFIRPERRVIRYAAFGPEIVKSVAAPTEAEIAARYQARKAEFAPREERRFVQLVVPTQSAANAVMTEVAAGKSLEQAAREKGLSTAQIGPVTRQALAGQASQAVADAVFAAAQGKLATPARSGLGWHVAQVAAINKVSGKTLDQVRAELSAIIAIEKQRTALADALEQVESTFDEGGNLVDEAGKLGSKVAVTPAITADGRVYLKPGETLPVLLRPVLQTAFTMDSESPQLAEVERGKTFIIFDVTEIAESAPAPLKEITDQVRAAYVMDQASAAAKIAARQVRDEMARGKSLRDALASLKRPLPAPQAVSMTRPELARMQGQGQQVPRPIALMFNMAKGTTKVQPAPNQQAWFIVTLTDIVPGTVAKADPLIETARRELAPVLRSEYSDALGRAIRDDLGVERNAAGIRAVRQRLGGES